MTYDKDSNTPRPTDNSETFWERRYASMTKPSGGRPSAVLTRFATGRKAGRALELGCARGDDAIWLARQGWTVTAVDISASALRAAEAAAKRAEVSEQIEFERHDLEKSFPGGVYDLVSAMFLQSPVEFGREETLARVAKSLAPGGLLLLATHGSSFPWSSAPPDMVFPSAQEELESLGLDMGDWRQVFVGPATREAIGPEGQRAEMTDMVIALERL